MGTMPPPQGNVNIYNDSRNGAYGEYGLGQGTKVFYMQVAFKPYELVNKINLIGEIRGSEKWSVPDLFQREVDEQRVNDDILPYLENKDLIKYFSPLTLTLLPIMDEVTGTSVVQEIPEIVEKEEEDEGGRIWVTLEAENLYKFKYAKDQPYYAEVSWNDSRIKPVAIDGQHRLSALKKRYAAAIQDESWEDYTKWSIPAVIFGLKKVEGESSTPSILEVVRNIFIYINKEAKPPTKNRNILLNDNSVNCILAQEVLEFSHQNDVRERNERDEAITPLLFYGWREDQIRGGQMAPSVAQLKTVTEIHGLIENYFLGEDFTPEQITNLSIEPDHELHEAMNNGAIHSENIKKTRKYLQKNILKGITHFFNNFEPYLNYSKGLRRLEEEKLKSSSNFANHAFHKLRFGTHQGLDTDRAAIDIEYRTIISEIITLKNRCIPDLIDLDISLRGIICAFENLRIRHRTELNSDNWLEYSKWFTNMVNIMYRDGWFNNGMPDEKKNLYKQIIEDHNSRTINYRFEDVKKAAGTFFTLIIGAYGKKNSDFPGICWDEIQVTYIAEILNTLQGGYKRQAKTELQGTPGVLVSEITERSRVMGDEYAREHLTRIESAINRIAS
jgi:hypothetical protein